MKFIFNGAYCQYRGYVFAYGKPTDVRDAATILALRRMPNFQEIKDGTQKDKAPTAPVPLKRPTLTLRSRK
jgi:hypothetical protein